MALTVFACIALIACEIAVCVPVQLAANRARVETINRLTATGGQADKPQKVPWLRSRLDSAGIELSAPMYLTCLVIIGSLVAALAATRVGALGLLIGAAVSILGSEAYIRVRSKNRLGDFEEQLGQALPMVASGVRIGMTFEQAMGNVAETMDEPLRSQVKQFTRERAYGATLPTAMENLAGRVKSRDMDDLATVVIVQSETGGKMADVLDSIAETIQQRERLRRHVAAVTADGRMSAAIIAAIPIVLLVLLGAVAPDYIGVMFTTPAGWAMLAVSATSILIGLAIIRKLYQIKIY